MKWTFHEHQEQLASESLQSNGLLLGDLFLLVTHSVSYYVHSSAITHRGLELL